MSVSTELHFNNQPIVLEVIEQTAFGPNLMDEVAREFPAAEAITGYKQAFDHIAEAPIESAAWGQRATIAVVAALSDGDESKPLAVFVFRAGNSPKQVAIANAILQEIDPALSRQLEALARGTAADIYAARARHDIRSRVLGDLRVALDIGSGHSAGLGGFTP